MASGRVLPMRSANTGPRRWRHAVLKACYAVRVRDLRMDLILQPDEMVISLIVRRWLESGAPDGAVYDLGTMTDREAGTPHEIMVIGEWIIRHSDRF